MLWVALHFPRLRSQALARGHAPPEAEREALVAVAIWLGQFTPRVSLEPPGSVATEVQGSLRLFGVIASVRGLRERETSGDKGAFVNLELHAPVWNSISPFFFYDAGWRKHVTPVAGLPTSDSASSVGVGARWSWAKRLEVSATIASVVNGVSLGTAPATDSGHTKLNFSLFYRF
ncbi:MAG: ShlB/FhaC/HecB family hemolysin secretion/activation protein [Burkholderiales bacterium]